MFWTLLGAGILETEGLSMHNSFKCSFKSMHQKAVADIDAKYNEAVTDDKTCQMQWWVVLVERAHSISSEIKFCQRASLLTKIVGPSG